MGIPSVSPQHPLEAARKLLKKGVAVPYSLPLPTEDTNWKVAFDSPSDITLAGSWANKVSVKLKDGLKFGVDLAVEMPNVSIHSQLRSKLTTFFRVFSKRRTILMEDSSTSDHSISQQLPQQSRAPSQASMWRSFMSLCLRMYA